MIERRLKDAGRDIAHWTEFDYVVINDRFETAVEDLLAIIHERGERIGGAPGRRWRAWLRNCWLPNAPIRRRNWPGPARFCYACNPFNGTQ